eukprot:5135329-Prymnesium_polylepis.1
MDATGSPIQPSVGELSITISATNTQLRAQQARIKDLEAELKSSLAVRDAVTGRMVENAEVQAISGADMHT